ncbi:cysteine protease StiP family protein (plasmid) [Deinococcus taeanensis]|uniref:cysteine protease StiP domain-containing protein n=1 Tax=Deinococcus taeanensis TaxID=2737050 RepID=UPI001CDD434E|nr:cysteine protease StiP domain-containing protein [Deinococcus taeanensis]UBV44619.1 cysteine protease StiP family protein [Deinococcus taeanensis]
MTPMPRVPLQSTFAPGDVEVLLQPGEVQLVSVAEKEALLRTGRSYGTLLTPEEAPGAIQLHAYRAALDRGAPHLGPLLAGLSRTLLSANAPAVYVSLARAGTPVGCVLRRLAGLAGRDVPHYTVSIIRGEGLDPVALQLIRRRHPDATLVFIDGWSGKGSIASTLRASVPADLRWRLAVLSDPAGVADHPATYEDLLLPHAALNATVSGLLSRSFTVARGELHGARLETALADFDVSRAYVDELTELARYAQPALPPLPGRRPVDPVTPVFQLAGQLGVLNPHHVKPSVGEATRVFLRRRPGHLLLRRPDHPDTLHLQALAAHQGVPVVVCPDLPYLAAALIHAGDAE